MTPNEKFKIRGIPSTLVEHFWPFAEPYIKRALEHSSGEIAPADIKMLCKDRIAQLWLINEGERVVAACTTEIAIHPQCKHCRICTVAGSKAPEWSGLLFDTIGKWAKEHDCVAISASVRKGYVSILANYGFKPHQVIVVKPID